jgi:hypothetical protein
MTAYLHDVGCTNDPCRCRVLYRVAVEQAFDYNSMTAVEAESDRIAHGVPVVLNPLPGRRSASSRLSR